MSNLFYATMITQMENGNEIGKGVLTEEYQTASEAFAAGEENKLNELSKVEVRQYDRDNKFNIISFDAMDTGKVVYGSREDLVKAVVAEYAKEDEELSEGYLEGIIVNMSKADLLVAWAEIQKACNGDVVVRLNESGKECENLIPDGWGNEVVCGDAQEALLGINEEKKEGGPVFARWYDDSEDYLDLVFGELESPSQDIEY